MIDKYNFQLGERVIDTYGRKGKITHICHCASCEERGFYEFVVIWDYNKESEDWVTCYDERKGFPDLHKVGKRVFNSLDLEKANEKRAEIEKEISELQEQKRYLTNGIKLIKARNKSNDRKR